MSNVASKTLSKLKLLPVLLVVAATAGCMSPDGERAAVGAAIGGVGAAALDGNILLGAAAGAAAGALCDDAGVCRRR